MKIYVGTYAKYNAGNLFGKWLDLEDYEDKDAFLEACYELHNDEEDPELMFQDWEDIPDGMVGESCCVDEKCWVVLKAYENHSEDAVNAYLYLFDEWDEDAFRDRYYGKFNSDEDMAEELLEGTGELSEIPERLRYYFDYEGYARDMRLNGDVCEHEGHYFWNY